MSEHIEKRLREYLNEQTESYLDTILEDLKQELKTAKEENKNLIQQNKQMREALESISEINETCGKCGGSSNCGNCSETGDSTVYNIAQQALGGE